MMKSPYTSLLRLALFAAAICLSHEVRADGKFFQLLEVADEPGIQAQRAVIAFKNGCETLIIQSDIEGEGSSLGWILPLPAEPTSIEPCEASSLMLLSGVVGPKVADVPRRFLALSLMFLVAMIAVCVDRLLRKDIGFSPLRILLGVIAFFLLAAGFLLPSLSRSRDLSLPDGVEVLQATKAGVYDVVVIRGGSGDAVGQWLRSNGFACPSSVTPIIQDYVSNKWCFLAAKVAPESNGTISHHPLKVSFPAAQAIYPLRLTGVDSMPIQLDLYVIGERRASASHMSTWLCDSFSQYRDYHPFGKYVSITRPIFIGRETLSQVGIPAISSLMWPGCVLTRLHGRLDAADMEADLTMNWIDPQPVRVTLYSRWGAAGLGAGVASIAFALAIAWSTRTATKRGWQIREMIRRRLLPTVVVALLVGTACYGMLEIVPTKATTRQQTIKSMFSAPLHIHRYALRALSAKPPELPFPEAYRQRLEERYQLAVMQENTGALERPGDFRIETTEDGWLLTIVDRYSIPISIPISSNGVPRLSSD